MKTISLDEAYNQAHNSAETSGLTPFESAREALLAHAFNVLPEVVAALNLAANQASILASRCGEDLEDAEAFREDERYFRSIIAKASNVEVPE